MSLKNLEEAITVVRSLIQIEHWLVDHGFMKRPVYAILDASTPGMQGADPLVFLLEREGLKDLVFVIRNFGRLKAELNNKFATVQRDLDDLHKTLAEAERALAPFLVEKEME